MPLNSSQMQRAREKFCDWHKKEFGYDPRNGEGVFSLSAWQGYLAACAELMPQRNTEDVALELSCPQYRQFLEMFEGWQLRSKCDNGCNEKAAAWIGFQYGQQSIAAAPSAPERQMREEGG